MSYVTNLCHPCKLQFINNTMGKIFVSHKLMSLDNI